MNDPMGNSLPCRRQIPLRKDARGERERSFSNSKFEDEEARLQCAVGKVARGSVKGDFRGVQGVVGGMRRRRWMRRVGERCIFGCRRSSYQDFIVVQRKSMSCERDIYYIYQTHRRNFAKKYEYGSKFCVMTFVFFFFGWVEPKYRYLIDYIHRCTGKEESTVPTNELIGRYLGYIYGHLVAVPWDRPYTYTYVYVYV